MVHKHNEVLSHLCPIKDTEIKWIKVVFSVLAFCVFLLSVSHEDLCQADTAKAIHVFKEVNMNNI